MDNLASNQVVGSSSLSGRAILQMFFVIIFSSCVINSALCHNAHANTELDLGSRFLGKRADGDAYQARFQHDMDQYGGMFSIARRYDYKKISVRLGYFEFSDQETMAEVTPRDDNYSRWTHNGCVGNCLPLATYKTRSEIRGLFVTASRSYRFLRSDLILEAGVTAHRADFTTDVENIWDDNNKYFYDLRYESDKKISLGSKIGVGIKHGKTSFMVHKYGLSSNATRKLDNGSVIEEPAPYSNALTASMRVEF